MKKLIASLAIAVAGLTMSACGGGGGGSGGNSTGGVYLTHSELAADFVYRLNVDMGYDVSLVKTWTQQNDYIVVYDYDLGTYDAYDIRYYNAGEDMYTYLSLYDDNFYYDLDKVGSNTYEHFGPEFAFRKLR
ncbi:MAG: hypothetical protein R2827_11530 [Bdellovibrionales bacterium]